MNFRSLDKPGLLSEETTRSERRRSNAVSGVWAAAYLLATTKWGSYAGAAPLFVADLLVAGAFWQLLTARNRSTQGTNLPLSMTQVCLLLALPIWATVRLIASESYGFNTFRDFAPYLYASIALLAAVGVSRSSLQQRRKTSRIIWIALLFHLVWTMVVVIFPSLPAGMPVIGNGVRLFSPREDIDSAYLGVTAAVALHRWSIYKKKVNLLIAAAAVVTVMLISSRAGLIATVFCLAIAAYFLIKSYRGSIVIIIAATLGPIALFLSLRWLLQLPAIARLIATVWPSIVPDAQDGYASAQGTTDARRQAWNAAIQYTNQNWDRSIFGSGFGSDFMAESGAARLLLGPLAADSGVRSPHNYFIGSYARLGLIGLFIIIALIAVCIVIIVASRKALVSEEFGVISSAVIMAVIPTAIFGVTLESPFGSIPFFWAVGAIFGFSRLAAKENGMRTRMKTEGAHA